jgi:hypothetical protein
MAFWIVVSVLEWTAGWIYYIYGFSKGFTSCCFIEKNLLSLQNFG